MNEVKYLGTLFILNFVFLNDTKLSHRIKIYANLFENYAGFSTLGDC